MPRQLIALALVAAGTTAHASPRPRAPSSFAAADPPPASGSPAAADPSSPPSSSAAADPAGAPPPAAADPSAPPPAPGAPATAPAAAAGSPGAPPAAAEAMALNEDIGDQAISVELGVAAGGRLTPGGLRITGQFIYQLSDEDWFDGGASFTFGSGAAACFRDRENAVICSHGLTSGTGVELSASIRRMLPPQGAFHPFVRLGVGLGLARYSDDDVTGFTIPAHCGGGVRMVISPSMGLVVEADLALGFGSFSRGIGSQPQLGLALAAGVEFRLR